MHFQLVVILAYILRYFSSNWRVISFFRYNFGYPSHRVLCLFGTDVLPFTCQICMYCTFKNIWALGFSYLWRCWKVCCWILYDWLHDGELTFCCLLTQSPGSSKSITFFILDANYETESLILKPFSNFSCMFLNPNNFCQFEL